MEKGNYVKRFDQVKIIKEKLNAGTGLTKEEIKIVCEALEDPLQEFCRREGTFRLIEMLGMDPAIANEKEEEAAMIIRENIDYDEDLYDSIDYDLRNEILGEEGKEED